MVTFWGVIAALTAFGGIPTVGGLWLFERRRSRARNRTGKCAACGVPWDSTSSGEPFLIHGRLVCEECAATARRRLPWHMAILALAAGGAGLGVGLSAGGLSMAILWPVGSTLAMTLGAVQLMKYANRKAQRRIAAGEFPDLAAIGSGAEEGRNASLPPAV